MSKAILQLLRPYKEKVFTTTAHNDKEFALHKKISKSLKGGIHFAHPFHAWERGLNETNNGLFRQYFPKEIDFRTIDDNSTRHAMEGLNNRPRKTLGLAIPNMVSICHLVRLST